MPRKKNPGSSSANETRATVASLRYLDPRGNEGLRVLTEGERWA